MQARCWLVQRFWVFDTKARRADLAPCTWRAQDHRLSEGRINIVYSSNELIRVQIMDIIREVTANLDD